MAARVEGTSRRRPHAGSSFTDVLGRAVGDASTRLSSKVDDWTDRLEDVAAGTARKVSSDLGDQAAKGLDELGGDGAKQQAVTRGMAATLRGDNPLWASLKGAWSAGGVVVRAAIVTAAVALLLLLVVSPVLLLVFLLSLLVVAAVAKARAAAR